MNNYTLLTMPTFAFTNHTSGSSLSQQDLYPLKHVKMGGIGSINAAFSLHLYFSNVQLYKAEALIGPLRGITRPAKPDIIMTLKSVLKGILSELSEATLLWPQSTGPE